LFSDFPLIGDTASTVASKVDLFFWFMVVVTGLVTLGVVIAVIYFALRYRRKSEDEIPEPTKENKMLEATWIVIPLVIFIFMFFWSAQIFFDMRRMPPDPLDVHVVGKQWMWKFQHPDGRSEINDLHVPVGRPIRLVMASEDVIHDFFVPQFRVHTDVLPARYTYAWFEATRTGVFHIFCSEYCGTEHSKMIGRVYVMEPGDYQKWLAGGSEESPVAAGEKLFQKFACNTCHMDTPTGRGPVLKGIVGSKVTMKTGATIVADEAYLRESIMNPRAKIVLGYEPIMPSFQGQLTEEQVLQLIAYLKSLAPDNAHAPAPAAAPTSAAKAPEGKSETAQ